MKKTPLLILASFIITFAFGQQQPSPPQPASPAVQFGIKGGLNLDNIETDLYKNRDARISFHAGLLAHIHINEHLAVQPELMYSAQGFKQEISSNLEMDFITDYINLPVLIQYQRKISHFQNVLRSSKAQESLPTCQRTELSRHERMN